jgi:hypothetical protein
MGTETPSVRRVIALVNLQSSLQQVRPKAAGVVFLNPERSTHLNLHVSLSAEDTSGRRIRNRLIGARSALLLVAHSASTSRVALTAASPGRSSVLQQRQR